VIDSRTVSAYGGADSLGHAMFAYTDTGLLRRTFGRADSDAGTALKRSAVVIDLLGDILHVRGETGKFLRPAPGQWAHNVTAKAEQQQASNDERESTHEEPEASKKESQSVNGK